MIRSSKHTIKFSNKNKKEMVSKILNDFKSCVIIYQKQIIQKKIPLRTNLSSKLLSNDIFNHSQWKQIAYKTASEIIRSNYKKKSNEIFKKYRKIYRKALDSGKFKWFIGKRYSELGIDILKRIKIEQKNISVNLDNRLWDMRKNDNHFNEFIRIKTPYFKIGKKRAIIINIPIKYHRQSLKYKNWDMKNTIRLSDDSVNFIYEKEEIIKKVVGEIIGVDIGYKKLIVDSNGKQYGTNLEQIYKDLTNKRRGSNSYKKLLIHKQNEIKRVLNNLNTSNIKEYIVEDLKNIKKNSKLYRKINNKMQYWSYRTVLDKLESLSEEEGFSITKVNPAYTSQKCSKCGNIDSRSRNREDYLCVSCGYKIDADYNAAINILSRGEYNLSNEQNNNL